jgi:hypothetical protein
MSCLEDNTIQYYFIGNNKDIQNEYIFKHFDTNYMPLENIPISYYETIKPKNDDQELNNMINNLNNDIKPYNNYNIYPISISILILLTMLFMTILRFIFFNLYHIYSYILIFIVLALIIIGSIWFIYVNNETL